MFLFKVINILMFFITLPNIYCLPLKEKSVVKVSYSNPKHLDSILSKCMFMFKLKCFVTVENCFNAKFTNSFQQYYTWKAKKKLSLCKVPTSVYDDNTRK